METESQPRLELQKLLSTCLALSRAACAAIKEVQAARETQVNPQILSQRRSGRFPVVGQRGPGHRPQRCLRSQDCTDLGRHPGTGYHLERFEVRKGCTCAM